MKKAVGLLAGLISLPLYAAFYPNAVTTNDPVTMTNVIKSISPGGGGTTNYSTAGSNVFIYMVGATNVISSLTDTQVVLSLLTGGAATNAVSSISSNDVPITVGTTNLNIWMTGTGGFYVTNRGGIGDVRLALPTLGSAAYSNSIVFQPSSTVLSNWSGVATNLVVYLTQIGTAAYSNGLSFQNGSQTLTNWSGVPTNLVAYLSQLGTAAYSNSIVFQPSSTVLSNWSGVATNLVVYLTQIGTAAYSNGLSFQNGSQTLTNWSGVPTNLVAYLSQLGTASYSNGLSFQNGSQTLTNWSGVATNLVAYLSQLGTAAYSNSISFQPANGNLTNWSLLDTNVLGQVGWTGNPNQFTANGGTTNIADSARVTNIYNVGAFQMVNGDLSVKTLFSLYPDGRVVISGDTPTWGADLSVGPTGMTASAFSGSGSNLFNLDGSHLDRGTINVARMGTGAGGGKYLRDDNTWQAVSAPGSATNAVSTISSNDTTVGTSVTNLNLWSSGSSSFFFTNRDGLVDMHLISPTVGTAAYSNSVVFQPANSVLSNWTGVTTNLVIYHGQDIVAPSLTATGAVGQLTLSNEAGTGLLVLLGTNNLINSNVYVAGTIFATNAVIATNVGSDADLLSKTGDRLKWTAVGTAAFSNSASFQPADADLTNWATVTTNLVIYHGQDIVAPSLSTTGTVGHLTISNDDSSAVVVMLGTNNLFNTNVFIAGTVYATNAVIATNEGTDNQVLSKTGDRLKWVAQTGGGGFTGSPGQFSVSPAGFTNIIDGVALTNANTWASLLFRATAGDDVTLTPYEGGKLGLNSTSDPWDAPIWLTTTGVTAVAFSGSGSNLLNLDGANLDRGTVAPARLGTGSGGSSKFLREDSTWQTVSAEAGWTGNPNQFAVSGGTTNIKSGVTLTNVSAWEQLTLSSGSPGLAGYLQLSNSASGQSAIVFNATNGSITASNFLITGAAGSLILSNEAGSGILVSLGTNTSFNTNVVFNNTVYATNAVLATNTGSDDQILSKTGDKMKWVTPGAVSVTNAVSQISSNDTSMATQVTNISLWPGNNITMSFTNRNGIADVVVNSTGGGGFLGNPNQFEISGTVTNIKSGALLTNTYVYTSLNFQTANTIDPDSLMAVTAGDGGLTVGTSGTLTLDGSSVTIGPDGDLTLWTGDTGNGTLILNDFKWVALNDGYFLGNGVGLTNIEFTNIVNANHLTNWAIIPTNSVAYTNQIGWSGNPNQFAVIGGATNIKDGAIITNTVVYNATNWTRSLWDTNMPGQEEWGNNTNYFLTPYWYQYVDGYYHFMSPTGWVFMTVREQGPFIYFGDPHYWDAVSFQVKSTEEGGERPRVTFHYGTNESSAEARAYRMFEDDFYFGSKNPGNDEINYPIWHHDNHGSIWLGSTNYTGLWGSNVVLSTRSGMALRPFGATNENTYPGTITVGSTTNYFQVETNRLVLAGPINALNSASIGESLTLGGNLYLTDTTFSMRRTSEDGLVFYVNDASAPMVVFTNYHVADVFTNQGIQLMYGDYKGDGGSLTNLNATELRSGTVNVARLGTGSGGGKFLRDDNTWQTVTAGGGFTGSPGQFSISPEGFTNLIDGVNVTNANAWASLLLRATSGGDDVLIVSDSSSRVKFDSTANPYETPAWITPTGYFGAFVGAGGYLSNLNATKITAGHLSAARATTNESSGTSGNVPTSDGAGNLYWATPSGGPTAWDGNPNQFSVSGGYTNIKSGALLTNISAWNQFTLSSDTAGQAGYLQLSNSVSGDSAIVFNATNGSITASNFTIKGAAGSLALSNAAGTDILVLLATNTFINTNVDVAGTITTTNLTVKGSLISLGNIYASGSNFLGAIVGLGSGGINADNYGITNFSVIRGTTGQYIDLTNYPSTSGYLTIFPTGLTNVHAGGSASISSAGFSTAGSLGFSGGGSGLTSLNASQLASGTVPQGRLGTNTGTIGMFLGTIGDSTVWTNAIGTNVTFTMSQTYNLATNAPTSNQTNYTVDFAGQSFQQVFTANTNLNVAFSNIRISTPITLVVNAWTSTVSARVTFPTGVMTNSQMTSFVTNGTAKFYNLIPLNGTDNTNVWVTETDWYRR